jgi:hypothetical protein
MKDTEIPNFRNFNYYIHIKDFYILKLDELLKNIGMSQEP